MSGFKVEFSVLNLKATPGIYADAFANRPAAGYPGRVFIDTDNPSTGMYRDTGTVWVQIAETATSDVDTLQNVTDNGNTTTNSISVGHASTPVAIIDARTPFTNLNNADSFCVAANTARNITSNASFGVNYVNTVYGFQSLVFNGNATIGNGGINSAGNFINFLNNNTTGTVSVTQAATIRAIAGTQTGIYYNTGAASTVFTHVAALKTLQPINTGSLPALVTNNYGLLVADNTANSGTITYTNRWGIYQEGASDKNYFAANVLIKSTTDNGNALQVTGNGYISANLGIGTSNPTELLSIQGNNPFIKIINNSTVAGGLFWSGIADAYLVQAGSTDAIIPGTVAGSLAYRTANKSHIWSNDGGSSAAMILDASGRLGIGTTSMSQYGVTANNASNSVYFNATSGSITTYYGSATALGIGLLGTFSNNDLGIYTNSAERMRITSGGDVFVNTILSQGFANKFRIKQSSDGSQYGFGIESSTSTSELLYFSNTGSVAVIGQTYLGVGGSYQPIAFSTGGSERMRITSGGNVLIGTTTDAGYKLDVNGSFNFTTGGNNITYSSGILYHGNYYQYPTGNDYFLYARANGGLRFGTNDTERMRITSGGSVAINTTSPDAASLLQMDSTTKGFLLPRMTDTQINAISNPPDGLMVYSTDQNHIAYYDAVAARWKKVSNSNL